MAKKTTTLRVHTLAKEIGVSSKDIIGKCQAEDIPDITNHMSAVSIGLSHTIREWFGGTESDTGTTAVETAAPVDVEKARKKAKKAKAKAKPKVEEVDQPAVAVETPEVAEVEETPAVEEVVATPTEVGSVEKSPRRVSSVRDPSGDPSVRSVTSSSSTSRAAGVVFPSASASFFIFPCAIRRS